MKRLMVLFAWMTLLLSMAGAHAGEYANGPYIGGKIGVVVSEAAGQINAPSESTVAYVLQGGYMQAGYVFDSRTLYLAAGAYVDWNPSEKHSNGIYYGSRNYGLDFKVGLPFGPWLPYAKLGYGYSTGTRDLYAVTDNSINGALGMEYKFAPKWSMVGEYKVDGYANKNANTSITNKMFTFGITYYFNAPPEVVAPSPVVIEEEEEKPVPVAVPAPVVDAPPI